MADTKVASTELIVPYKDIYLAQPVLQFMPAVESMKIRDDDIFIITYPKCGTTWMQAIVWLIMNDADSTWKGQLLEDLVPMIEYPTRMLTIGDPSKVDWKAKPSPRILKTHIPLHLLNGDIIERKKQPKIIYVTRNPKDTLVSFYHFETGFILSPPFDSREQPTFERFFQDFLEETCQFGSYWKHNKEVWDRKDWDNILFVHYEHMLKDPLEHVEKVAKFLGKNLEKKQLETIVKETTFSTMRQNEKLNYSYADKHRKKDAPTFFRKGKVGDWKNHLTVAMSEEIDKVHEKYLKDTGLIHDFGN